MFGLHGLINPAKEPDLDTNGGLMYYSYNGRHTVSELTDHHGDLIESYRYEAFGGIFEGITAPYNTSSYTGHQYDDVAGLMDMKARWYDPRSAGFLSEDTYPGTLTTPFTQNRYAYVGNNPINMWDPTGHVPDWVEAKSDHVDYYGDHIDSYWWKKWTYQSYNVTYSSAWLAGSTKDERNIYETYAQNQYETWNYYYQYSRTIFDEDDNVIDIVGGNSNETYSDTQLYSWTNTISAATIAGQNKTVLQSYGPPPANAKALFSYSSVNGVVDSAKVLIDDEASLSSIEMQIIKDGMLSLIDKHNGKPVSVLSQTCNSSGYNGEYCGNSFVYGQLAFMGEAWHAAAGDVIMQNQIHATAEYLRNVVDSGANYAIISLDTFLPVKSGTDPWGDTYLGNGDDRQFKVNDIQNVKTLQYGVVNLDYNSVVGFNYVTVTERIDDEGKVIKSKRDSNSAMDWIEYNLGGQGDSNYTSIGAVTSVRNELSPLAPPLDYTVNIQITDKGNVRVVVQADKFPSYEGYISINGGEFNSLYQLEAIPWGTDKLPRDHMDTDLLGQPVINTVISSNNPFINLFFPRDEVYVNTFMYQK